MKHVLFESCNEIELIARLPSTKRINYLERILSTNIIYVCYTPLDVFICVEWKYNYKKNPWVKLNQYVFI